MTDDTTPQQVLDGLTAVIDRSWPQLGKVRESAARAFDHLSADQLDNLLLLTALQGLAARHGVDSAARIARALTSALERSDAAMLGEAAGPAASVGSEAQH